MSDGEASEGQEAKAEGDGCTKLIVGVGCIFPIAAFALIFLVILLWGAFGPEREDERPMQHVCEGAIRARLKVPSTADVIALGWSHEDGVWQFDGTVDAENSFGAKLRSTWVCQVSDSGTVLAVSIT